MFYDRKNNIIISKLPKNSIGSDGQFYINFDSADNINLWADHGYFSIRTDSPAKPSDAYEEEILKRQVTIDYPYADVIRVWKQVIDSTEI
jgi:hypothetical protein